MDAERNNLRMLRRREQFAHQYGRLAQFAAAFFRNYKGGGCFSSVCELITALERCALFTTARKNHAKFITT